MRSGAPATGSGWPAPGSWACWSTTSAWDGAMPTFPTRTTAMAGPAAREGGRAETREVRVTPPPSTDSSMTIELVEGTRHRRAAEPAVETPASTIAGSAVWLLVSNLIYAGCQWGIIVGL